MYFGGKTMKRTLSILTVFALLAAFILPCYAKVSKISNVNDATSYILEQSDVISIRRATLNESGRSGRTVYLIALGGSDYSWNEASITCLQNAIRSGCSMQNSYLSAVIAKANEVIPKGSEVVLIGHSMGGMIAQQFADDDTMKANYNISYVLTMGASYILDSSREGVLHRMADSADLVPYLSAATLLGMYSRDLSVETSVYSNPLTAHTLSYSQASCWQQYDALGVKGGSSTISL